MAEIRTKKEMKHWRCVDCGTDTMKGDNFYMVNCDIWNRYGLGGSEATARGWRNTGKPSGMLCIPCLEDRMGRKLQKSDLPDWPVNHFNLYTAKILWQK